MAKKKTDTGQLDLFGESNTIQLLNGQIAMIEKKILALFGSTYKYAAQLAQVRDAVNSGNASFTFQSNPAAAKEIENRLTAVAQTLDQQLAKSTEQSYALGQASTNNALVQAFGKDKQTKKELKEISDDAVAAMRKRGADGHTFYTQPQGGVTISDRVWKLTESTKLELEIAIQNAVLEGQSADELARTIQQYLTHPDRLFRSIRVIDKETGQWTGEYKMSEAAKRCHPGQGVYRSSYKNALRLARTELTQAYRRAEWETYQDNPLITGYRIELSNNHTTEVMTKKGRKTIPLKDICDRMAGTEYPKTFLWTGWHPVCRCRMVPIMVTKNDFKERVKARHTGKLKEWQPKEQTTEMPKVFVEWVNDNKSRWQANGKAAPFFIRDNYQQGEVDKGLDTRITAAIEEAKLAAATAKAKAEEPKKAEPKPITDYDVEIQALRDQAVKYELNLAEIERLRTTGTDASDIKKLQADIKKAQKERKEREKRWNEKIKELKDAIKELQSIEAAFLSASPTADEKTAYQNAVKEAQQALIDNAIATGNTYTTSTSSLDIATAKAQQAKADADKVMNKAKATSAAAKKEPVYIGNKTPQKAEVKAVKLQKQIDDLINKGYSRRDAEEAVAIENIQKTNGLTKAEAEEEYRAVQSYTGSYYLDIREAQRDAAAGKPFSKKYFEEGERLEKFIKESPKWQKTTYRCVAMPEAVFLKYSVGQIIDMGGATTSFATTQGVAQRFKNTNYTTINNTGVEYICENPQNGTSVAFYSSSGEGEHEILCSKKQQYKILSITYKRDNPYGGKDYIIRLEAL